MTPWQDRRDAARLDEAVEAMLRGASPFPAAPAEGAAAVGTLLAAREELEREIAPRPDFSSALRIRLVAEAERSADLARSEAAAPVTSPAGLALSRPSVRRPRLLAGLVAGAVLAGTGATAAAASRTSLPGEALYPVKLGIERLAVVGDAPDEAGRERLEQASTRLDEAAQLIARGDPGDSDLAVDALAAFAARATEGGSALLAADLDGRRGAAQDVRTFAQASSEQIEGLAPTADDDLFTALVTAANTVYALDSQVDALCPTCAGRAAPLASFARAADEVSRILDGLSGVEVTAEESTREAAERIAGETPRREVVDDKRPAERSPRTRRREPTATQAPAPEPTSPTIRLPRVPKVPTSDVPVVGSTLDEVQDVVEERVIKEVEDQVGRVTDDLLGETGTILGETDRLLP